MPRVDAPSPREPLDGDGLDVWARVADEVSDVLATSRGLEEAAPALLRATAERLGCDAGAVWTRDARTAALSRRWAWRRGSSGAASTTGAGADDVGAQVVARAWTSREPVWARDVASALPDVGVAVPIVYGVTVHAVLEWSRATPLPATDAHRVLARALGKQIGQFAMREAALRDSLRGRRELADLFENAPVGVLLLDREGRILRVNRAQLDALGFPREQILGRRWRELHEDPSVADDLLARLTSSELGADVVDLEARLRCRDGSVKQIHVNANVLRDDGGFVHVRAFAHDVTQVRQAVHALRASDDRYRRLVEAARDYAIHALDRDGRVTSWNAGAEALFGFTEADVLGRDFAVTFSPEDRADDVPGRMMRLAADEGEFRHEGWRLRKNGSRFWAEVSYTALRDASGAFEAISQLTRDGKERRRLEELRRRSSELESANRIVLEADRRRAEIVRSVASAVEGPTQDIEAAVSRLEARAPGPSSSGAVVADGAAALGSEVRDLSAAVAGLRRALEGLDQVASEPLGRGDAAPEAVDLARLAEDGRALLREAASARRVRVDVDVEPGLDDVVASPAALGQTIYNLLANGIRASRERGRVALRVLAEGAGLFRIEVEDSGVGVAPEEVAGLFADRGDLGEGDPAGAALAATRRIVEQQGGRVGAQSTPGRGSVLFAVLPRVAPSAREADATGSTRATSATRSVLVVSENSATRASIAWTLGHVGAETVAVDSSEDAIEASRDRRFDVVAVDLGLGGAGAVDLLASLRGGGASRDVALVVAALGSAESGAAGLVVRDLLPRPAPADRLFAALERARVPRNRATVVVVDGDLTLLAAVGRTLGILGYRALTEADGNAALRVCAEEMPAAVVLSPFLHGMDPFRFLAHLRRLPGLSDVPVLLTIPRRADDTVYAALESAAQAAAQQRTWADDLAARPTGPSRPTPAR